LLLSRRIVDVERDRATDAGNVDERDICNVRHGGRDDLDVRRALVGERDVLRRWIRG